MSGASSNIQSQIDLKAPLANPSFTGTISAVNLTLSGDLTVNGTITTLNSTTLTVDDKNIELGSVASPTDITADGGGITLKGTTDKTFNWVDSTDSWTSSENIDLAANKKFTVASNPVMCPTGMLAPFAGSAAPDGWLLCAGQAVSRETYAGLFAVVGTTYGVGDNSTTFNLPDLRGRTAVGKDDMGGSAANRVTSGISGIAGITLGAVGGNENVHQHSHANTATFAGSAVNTTNESSHTHANSLSNNTVASASHRHDFKIAMNDNYYMATGSNAAIGSGGSSAGAYRYSSSSYSGGTVEATITDTRVDASSVTVSSGQSARFTSVGDTTQSSNQTVSISNAAGSAHNHSVTAAGTVSITNANFGTGTSQNMQPSIILNYIIKY